MNQTDNVLVRKMHVLLLNVKTNEQNREKQTNDNCFKFHLNFELYMSAIWNSKIMPLDTSLSFKSGPTIS